MRSIQSQKLPKTGRSWKLILGAEVFLTDLKEFETAIAANIGRISTQQSEGELFKMYRLTMPK